MSASVRKIDFCIPVIAPGIRYLDHLVRNIECTAARPDRIRFHVSYHSADDLKAIEGCAARGKLTTVVHAPPRVTQSLATPSANHSTAMNALAAVCTGDIAIFSDYDMAFVRSGWDTLVENVLFDRSTPVLGVTYPAVVFPVRTPEVLQRMPWLAHTAVSKYQQVPNLSFFCVTGQVLQSLFGGKLTDFDSFLLSGGLPFRLVNTPEMAAANNLPLGSVQWMDTGYEIPEQLSRNNVPYLSLLYALLGDQDVLQSRQTFAQMDQMVRPEVFLLPEDKRPLLCHYKKGSAKTAIGNAGYPFETFAADIERYLLKAQSAPGAAIAAQ
jgi:hypothetical protein